MTTNADRPIHPADYLLILLMGRRGGVRQLEVGARILLEERGIHVELDPVLWPLPAGQGVDRG
jgi:hypothetical protein